MRILLGINTLEAVEQPVYSNHLQLAFRLGRNFPNDTFVLNTPRRMSIDRMRNMSAKLALESECDYLMFIDDDVVVPINCLRPMLDADKDIVAAWTIIRGYPFQNMFFRSDGGNGMVHVPDEDITTEGLNEVDAVGFSCVLIKCSLLKKIPPPWFITGTNHTEDIYFCIKAKRFRPETSIFVDTSLKTYHNLGPEFISPENKKTYKKYYEDTYPDLVIIDPISDDRGQEYMEAVTGETA